MLLEDEPHRHSRDGFSNSEVSNLTVTEFLVYAGPPLTELRKVKDK